MTELCRSITSLETATAIICWRWSGTGHISKSSIKIEPQKFEDYLREVGMEYITAERVKLGETGKEGRECYSRYIKSLLQVGAQRDETYQRQVGLRLEITPLENPYAKRVGDTLCFRVVFEGKPLADKMVFADNRTSATQKIRKEADGKITMKIERKLKNKSSKAILHIAF